MPLSRAAEIVISLKTEPNGYRPRMARLNMGVRGLLRSAVMASPRLSTGESGLNRLGSNHG